jgi:predicted adenine nucleotide alpha hydrolase (AANH) superfamily ATPase
MIPRCDITPERTTAAHGEDALLLHVCCGPCALLPVRRLQDAGYRVTGWFMNPNIHPLTEYLRRREAAEECAQRLGTDILFDDEAWDIAAWLRVATQDDAPPARCHRCCRDRIEAVSARAIELGFPCFSTSLLYSRYQPHEAIRAAGMAAAKDGIRFVYEDFRRDWQMGQDTARQWGVYRQPYCGCVYSEAERYRKRLARLAAKSASSAQPG